MWKTLWFFNIKSDLVLPCRRKQLASIELVRFSLKFTPIQWNENLEVYS